jgi:valyl-tRNA synthetase
MDDIPKKYDHLTAEKKWAERWEEVGLYRWDPGRPRSETFVVDTPPPTVSGSLHVGHGFSYTHQDVLVRYQRMRGRNICYPMGWDDNGLPTERRVQNVLGVRPNPKLPYDASWKPRHQKEKGDGIEEISRLNFIEACAVVTAEDEVAYEETWRRLALSVDWTLNYATIDERCRRAAQLSFLDLHRRGYAYQAESPTMWDIDFRTAVAQAEAEDRERPGAYHDIRFGIEGGGEFVISTTRPELLGACIAVVAHPDDARYRPLFGKRAVTPLFHAPVPILPARHADPEKGTGILMVCTFGDLADVEFWKQSGLPLKQLIGFDGRLLSVRHGEPPFESLQPDRARSAWAQLEGLKLEAGRRKLAELMAEPASAVDGSGSALVGEPRPVRHPVKFYENGERPLEFVPTRQWFVRLLEHRQALLEQGRKITWHPDHMRTRYEHWVEGLNQDWCISRQRYSGVPFPVWYPVRRDGAPDYERPILAAAEALPVDPLASAPPGYREEQRDRPDGFTGDPDVMDTWATSSLTPQIVSGWGIDEERHAKLFPMDLRPQSHEIIRTWAFYTIVKAWMHEGKIPWKNVLISGWVVDPDRKKMSKSKGNVMTPQNVFDEFSADAYRYWAARNRCGVDTTFDKKVIQVGRRLCTKLFNASRFALGQLDRIGEAGYALTPDDISEPLDAAFAARLRDVVSRATEAFERFDWAAALHGSEEAFWEFCDDYLELVKVRSYEEEDTPGRRSALATLQLALRTFLRLFAPFVPYVTEEVWSWRFAGSGRERSVHTSPWPSAQESAGAAAAGAGDPFGCAMEVMRKIRSSKTRAKRGLRWPVSGLEIAGRANDVEALRSVLDDVLRAGAVEPGAHRLLEGPAPDGEHFAVRADLAEETA